MLATARLSLRTHPWLADHRVNGVVLLPGTGLVEMVIRAGDEAGASVVEELMLQAPLVLPEQGGVQVQVVVGAEDDGRRPVSVHSRLQDSDEWTRHATGTLTAEAAEPDFDLSVWPPVGAEPVDVDGVYDGLASAGLEYGPVFQGLTAAWRLGGDVYAEVTLPDRTEGSAFGLHPAVLDATLHASRPGATPGSGLWSRSPGRGSPCTAPGRRPCGYG